MQTLMRTPRRTQLRISDLPRTKLDEWYEAQEALRHRKQEDLRAEWKAQDAARHKDPTARDATLDKIWVGYIWRHNRWELGGFLRYRRRRERALTRNLRWARRYFGVARHESLCIKALGDAQREGPPTEPPQHHNGNRPEGWEDRLPVLARAKGEDPANKESPFMKTRRLLAPALVAPANRMWGCPRVLAKYTTVALLDAKKLNSKPSPVNLPGERLVAFSDENGNLIPGWLNHAQLTKQRATEEKLKTPLREARIDPREWTALDRIRDVLFRQNLSLKRWLATEGRPAYVPRIELRKAIRELGGEFLKTDGFRILVKKLIELLGGTLPRDDEEERPRMAKAKKISKATRSRKQRDLDDEDEYEDEEDEEQYDDEEDEEEEEERPRGRKKAKASKAAKSSKKAAKSSGSGRRSLLASVGHQLLAFAPKAKVDSKIISLATKMSKDQPLSVKQYDLIVDGCREQMGEVKMKEMDRAGLQKALRGVRMCQAKVA